MFRLQLSAATTGAASAFDITDSTGTSIFSAPGAAVMQQGTDAQVTLYAGTPAVVNYLFFPEPASMTATTWIPREAT